jgi:hypothetical protein
VAGADIKVQYVFSNMAPKCIISDLLGKYTAFKCIFGRQILNTSFNVWFAVNG